MDDGIIIIGRGCSYWPPNAPQVYPKCTFAGDFGSGILIMSKKDMTICDKLSNICDNDGL